jgi:DNA mismatch repair protein MutH
VRTFQDLLDRISAVQGVPFTELARAHGIEWSKIPSKNKSLAGDIAQVAMGVPRNSRPEPDLSYLGLELKTIPIGEGLRVLERTKLRSLNFQDTYDRVFEGSDIEHKLRSIIFAPIVKYDVEKPEHWYIRSPFIWMPSTDVYRQIKADYDEIRGVIRAGTPEALSSKRPPRGQGAFMIASTSGRDREDLTSYVHEEREIRTKRRAWMLRKEFTQQIIDENVRYRPRPVRGGALIPIETTATSDSPPSE